jgi:hypothetical protein
MDSIKVMKEEWQSKNHHLEIKEECRMPSRHTVYFLLTSGGILNSKDFQKKL